MYMLDRLERAVNTILNRLGETPIAQSARSATPHTPNLLNQSHSQPHDAVSNQIVAPIYVLRDLAADAGAESPQEVRTRHEISSGGQAGDIISEGLLSLQEATGLLQMFVLSKKQRFLHRLTHSSVSKSIMESG
jgi:hypothetical protein